MGALDLLKSERGLMNLLYLGVLAVLLFTHADKAAIDTWALYAGSVCAVYTAAKSLKPNDTAPPRAGVVISREETADPGSEVVK